MNKETGNTKSERYLSKAEFARLCRVSKAAISKALKANNIVCVNGKIDLEHELNAFYLEKNLPRADWKDLQKSAKAPASEKQSQSAEVPIKSTDECTPGEPTESLFTDELERLTAKIPKDAAGRLRNEIAFSITDLFSAFDFWTGGRYQAVLKEKRPLWINAILQNIEGLTPAPVMITSKSTRQKRKP